MSQYDAMQIISSIPDENIIFEEPKRKLVVLQLSDFVKLPIVNWIYNRPFDPIRIPEIADGIMMKKPILDGMFYMNYNPITKKYEIIDGIHRYEAIQSIMKTITKDETTDWLMEKFVTINIYYENTTQELYDIFEIINKSIPIPEIYKKETEEEKKVCIYEMVSTLERKYRNHFSGSPKYNIPNMNRDSLMDILSRYYDKYENEIRKCEMLELLLHLFSFQTPILK